MPSTLRYQKTVNTQVTRVPRAFLSVYVTSTPNADTSRSHCQYDRIFRSCSIGEYTRKIKRFTEKSEFNHEYLGNPYHYCESLIELFSKHDSLWVLCDGISRTLTLLDFWKYFSNGKIEIPGYVRLSGEVNERPKGANGYISIGNDTEMIKCRSGSCNLTFVSIANYGSLTIKDIADQYNEKRLSEHISLTEDSDDYPDAMQLQRIMARWYCNLMEYWRENDCGTWKETAPQLSHSLFKRQFMKETKYNERGPLTDRLERSAVFGGRTSIWYAGECVDVKQTLRKKPKWYKPHGTVTSVGTIYRIDVSSMYPYIFANYNVPGDCIFHDSKGGLPYLKSTMDSGHIVCASVRLKTNISEYPTRKPGGMERIVSGDIGNPIMESIYKPARVLYPTGSFDTVLVGPELEMAIEENAVIECYEYALYSQSNEYADYFRYLLNRRYECKISGNKFEGQLWKLISNSFGGKLAQRNCGWRNCNDWPAGLEPWKVSYHCHAQLHTTKKYRCIGDYPQEWHDDEYSPNGRPIVWAFICAVGRYIMRCIRAILPNGSYMQQDTDGMYVTKQAIDILQANNLIHPMEAGNIRIVSEHKQLRCYGPRHYIVDFKPIMSGLSLGFKPSDDTVFEDTKQSCVLFNTDQDSPNKIQATKRLVNISIHNSGYVIQNDGTVISENIYGDNLWKSYGDDPLASLFRGLI